MKKFIQCLGLMFLFTTLFSSPGFSANELFRSIATGNWNSNSTWEMSTNGGGVWFAATSTPRDTSGTITIRNSHTVTVTSSTTANQLVIDSGAVLTINNTIILTITAGTGNDVNIVAGGTLNGPGTVRTQGTIELGIPPGSAFNAPLNVNTGTTIATDNVAGYLFGNILIDAGAVLNGGNALNRKLFTYGNITNNGTLTTSSTGGIIRIKGPTLVNNGAINAIGNFYFDSTNSISGSGSFTSSNQWISPTGNVTLISDVTITPSAGLTIQTGGVLNLNGYVLTYNSGTFGLQTGASVNSPGTFKTQGTVGVFPVNGSFFNGNLNVNSGNTTSGNTTVDRYFGNVSIDNGATLNCGNALNRTTAFYGSVTNNGTMTTSSTGGIIRIKGPSLINNGSINAIGSFYFDSVTSVSGSGSLTSANQYITPTGNVTLMSDVSIAPTSGLTMQAGAAVLNLNGFVMTYSSGTFILNAGNAVNSPGTVRTQNNVAIYTGNSSAFNGDLKVNTGSLTSGTTAVDKFYGNVTIDNGTSYNCGTTLNRRTDFYGNVTNNGTLFTSSTGGLMRIKGPSFVNNGIVSGYNFYFDSTTALSGSGSFTTAANFSTGSNVTAQSGHQFVNFNIGSGATFNISNCWIKVNGNNPISQTGTFVTTNSTVEYNGAAAQTVSTTGITYSKLRINNTLGTTLSSNVTVTDSLIIQLGILDITTRILTISPTGYLLESPGNVVKGTTGYLTTTRSINAPSSLDVAGFGAVLTTASNLGSTEIRRGHAVQTGGSIKRYYDITPTNNSGLNATLKFKYDQSELNLRPESSLRLFKSTNSGSTWTNMGGTVNTVLNEITIGGLSSFSRWTADSSGVSAVINFAIEGYYNPSNNRLRMEDTVRLYLRQTSSPFSVVDSAVTLLDSVLLKAAFVFPNAPTGTYYIQIKHRNALETWSKSGGESYTVGNTLNYDFYSTAASAFGANQVQVDASPVRFAIFSGDINQDGVIDGSDGLITDNDAANFESGYVNSDVDGNRFVDGSDAAIVDNNSANFISVARP